MWSETIKSYLATSILTGATGAVISTLKIDTVMQNPAAYEFLEFMSENVWHRMNVEGTVPVVALTGGLVGGAIGLIISMTRHLNQSK